ncbi:thioredoxin family protein [Thalassotalea aquiviva]|uniref:thioredoxin family protein n=1 Tax=Thalassotalea aquiviva TaxID=3242415 RepID=UPI00352A3A2B
MLFRTTDNRFKTTVSWGCWLVLLSLFKPVMAANKVDVDLVGKTTKVALHSQFDDFANSYFNYIPSDDEVKAAKTLPQDVHIDVYFATWCHDSQREVPRLLKIFNDHGHQINLIALDRHKSDPLGLAESHQVKYTPTIIMYAKEKELGRIIEVPNKSLSEDLLEFWQVSQ